MQLVLVDRVRQAAAQGAARRLIQLLEQRVLPGVPELRVRAAHVGHRQHVEVIEVRLVADRARELADDGRVGDVPLLGGQRQQQVLLHQPGDQPRVVAAHAVLEAERLGVDRAELRVVAAAALGDVVEQPGEVRDLGLLEPLHDLGAARELVVVARQREAAQVLDHEQRVRVDRVGVEQVVLHAADDAAERRDVAPEHAVAVHSPQLVGDALRGAQDLEEQPVIARVLAELVVDEVQVLLDERDRARADAAQIEDLLEQQEQFEQRRRLALEDLIVGDLEEAVAL